jgi:hypothetical protein
MYYVRWTLWIVVWLFVAAFFHYTLPQNDIVRVTDTYEKRIDFGENSWFWASADAGNAATLVNRDVLFIETRFPDNTGSMVYRNEDTGWGWPPYFKFDTANLRAEATDLKSTSEAPVWVAVKHYGWRNEYLSIYPNAVSVRQVESPDVTFIPWLNIVILTVFAALVWGIYVRLRRFRQRRIDPALAGVGEAFDRMGDNASSAKGRMGRWFDSFRGPSGRR